MHNEFSLGIPHLNQFNHLTYKMRRRNISFYELLYARRKTGMEPFFKWVENGASGQSQEWDLLTHLMSTSSEAACWMWLHPLPHNPTRDDLAAIGFDKNSTVCHTGSRHHFDVIAFHDEMNHVTELFASLRNLGKREKDTVQALTLLWRRHICG